MNQTTQTRDKNLNLNDIGTKNKIFKYLHKSGIKLDTKHENILRTEDLDNLKNGDYIICPIFKGIRCLIIFLRVEDQYYAVSFPKYSKRDEKLRFHPIKINVGKELYRGTIMEGVYYKMDNINYLVIDEVYILSGEKQLLMTKDDRLSYLTNYLKKQIKLNPYYYMYVSQYYDINPESLTDLYDKIKSSGNPIIYSLLFYPKLYGRKVYTYTINDADLIDNIIKLTYFMLQKTNSPDVYNLLALNTGKKIDIAYIPDIDTSKKCKQWFKDYKCQELLVKCQMNMKHKKWVPVDLLSDDEEE